MTTNDKLIISGSPHIHAAHTDTAATMRAVILALMPAVLTSLWWFGLGAAIVICSSVVTCVATEWFITRYMLRRPSTIRDGSAALTGLLLALTLPSNIPAWAAVTGGIFAIGIGKMAFGGLGSNIFNPAMAGRVFMLISFPVLMTTWPVAGQGWLTYTDATTGATILGAMSESGIDPSSIDIAARAVGNGGGSLGETGAIALLLGFGYLLIRRIVTWHIPVAILGTVALLGLLTGTDIIVELLSGGLLLGALFMATDYVTSPMTRTGMVIYGILIGAITFVIRHYGAYPEGISFAILIMNGCTPLINRLIHPRRTGARHIAI